MSRGINKVILIGQLGNDPEVKATSNGSFLCNLSLATNESWKDKEGVTQEKTEWHRIVVYGKLAEICGQYLKKGSKAYVEGKLQTRKWTDQNEVERYTTEIVVDPYNGVVQFLDTKTGDNQNQSAPAPVNSAPQKKVAAKSSPAPAPQNKAPVQNNVQQPIDNEPDPFDDDIPF